MLDLTVQHLMDHYAAELDAHVPGLVQAIYLHGSIALNAFNPTFSDVDFITVLHRRCTQADLAQLTRIHQTLAAQYPTPVLQGCYLQPADLGQLTIESHPYYSDGVLHPSGQGDINSVTWWLLKNKGVAVRGADPQTLAFTVDWGKLVADMRVNLNTYWAGYTTQPARMAWLMADYGVQWVVLGVLRQYYTFCENDITSKAGAGEYALKYLPRRWHRIVQEALNIRHQTVGSLYGSRVVRAWDALQFLKFVIQSCNSAETAAVYHPKG